ncbi:HEAT repeat domain-containing protein [Pannus brasiliensis CCIBt3594]|uniref:HEAT repeat domain-containing protein n=1 Tax=Pannus brasiliensis CCIBt3594 TaxID=1427578 RepID=A0AAW9QYK8_9CHRO
MHNADMTTERDVTSQKKNSNVNWHKICQIMLERALPLNPFTTHPEEVELGDDEISLSVETREGRRYTRGQLLDRARREYNADTIARPLVIVGPPGSGKTFLLNQIAFYLLKTTDALPIWIAASSLGSLSPREYLEEKWLSRTARSLSLPDVDWTGEFDKLLDSGRVWFFFDGVEDFSFLNEYRAGWADRTRALLSCRYGASALDRNFEVYRILPLAYPTEVKKFIERWFARDRARSTIAPGENNGELSLADLLGRSLERFGRERLRECLETPLRLALLCRLWQECQPHLPTARAGLYRRLVRQFYQWQAEIVPTAPEHQQQLEWALGRLALQALLSEEPLSDRQVSDAFENNPSLVSLAIRLGWLTTFVPPGGHAGEKGYAFLDEAFRDYFAATAIEDWRFFLPELPANGNEIPAPFPAFEERWKRVILFWLGNEKRSEREKSAFLDALTDFQDRCGSGNLYGKRAHFLAVAGLAEFDVHERATAIVQQVTRWAFEERHLPAPLVEGARNALRESDRDLALDALLDRLPLEGEIPKDLRGVLEKIGSGHPRAIAALTFRLENAGEIADKCQIAEILDRLEPGHPLVLQTLLSILETATDDEPRHLALSSLERLGKAESPTLVALARLLQTGSPSIARRAFLALETIGRGNATAIATLVQLIRTTRDPLVHCQAAESLERIDPGNPTAIAVLARLLQTATSEDIRQQAVYRLGEITPGNPGAIAALVNLLAVSRDGYTAWLAISSLGKIGAGSPEVIETLAELVRTSDRALLRRESLDSLVKIAPDHPICTRALIALIDSDEGESTGREAAETLGRLDPGNPEAIEALSAFLKNSDDDFTRRQAAASLGTIDPGNLEAIHTLVRLARSAEARDLRELAVQSLGEIGTDNPAAIATLIRCLQTERDPRILKQAARSLGGTGRGHREAIAALSRLCRSSVEEATRLQAVESLIQIVPRAGIGDIVREMAAYSSDPPNNALSFPDRPDPVIQTLLWKCSRQISYTEFYRAWHHPARKTAPIVPARDDFATLLSGLSGELPGDTRFLCIDSAFLLDIERPVVDIYDQMLAQNCPPFEYGIPETLSKLRLYWNNLRREREETRLIWVFYENPLQAEVFSADFLAALSKFPGDICLVTEREVDFPVIFSPKAPRSLLQWVRENSRQKV